MLGCKYRRKRNVLSCDFPYSRPGLDQKQISPNTGTRRISMKKHDIIKSSMLEFEYREPSMWFPRSLAAFVQANLAMSAIADTGDDGWALNTDLVSIYLV